MGFAHAAAGGRRLSRCLRLLCVVGAVLLYGGLPALAHAEESESEPPPRSCPAGELPLEEVSQPEREVRELRNDLAEVCEALRDRIDLLLLAVEAQATTLESIDSGVSDLAPLLVSVESAVDRVHGDLTAEEGVGVQLLSQVAPVEVVAPEGVEISNPPDVAAVEASVREGTDTSNQNTWAVVGLLVGFGLLAVIYKVVRP